MDVIYSMGLDANTLMYLGYSIAAIASIGATYFATKHGMPVLDLQYADC